MASLGDDTNTSTEEVIARALQEDDQLQSIINKLDNDVIIDPDRELDVEASDSIPRDSDTASNSSSLREIDDSNLDDASPNHSPKFKKSIPNGSIRDSNGSFKSDTSHPVSSNGSVKDGKSAKTADTESLKSKKSVRKNPLQLLKKLTKFDKPKQKPDYRSEFSAVVVDKLPQVFVVKYLGHRVVSGVCGLHHVRKPVDEMVAAVRSKVDDKAKVELPLLYVVVSPKGLDLREHKSNKVQGSAPLGLMPIDFISYGVQDIKYWRVFTCIVVRELSSRSRSATCHAFLCDSSHNGRKMALSLGAAFNMYSKQLRVDGKPHNFQIELRPPDELADTLNAECEA